MQRIIKLTRLPTYTILRWLFTAPKGKGNPVADNLTKLRKLALTPGPYTSGGRIITISKPVSCASKRKPSSASYLETPYGSSGIAVLASAKAGHPVVLSPLTLIELI